MTDKKETEYIIISKKELKDNLICALDYGKNISDETNINDRDAKELVESIFRVFERKTTRQESLDSLKTKEVEILEQKYVNKIIMPFIKHIFKDVHDNGVSKIRFFIDLSTIDVTKPIVGQKVTLIQNNLYDGEK
jgi:hypothetical protein